MRHLIIDGYNVLRSSPRYSAFAERDLDAARERLISDLGARAAEGERVTVVFDGGGNPSSDGAPREVGGVTVVFSPSGVEADAVIEGLARGARDAAEEALVVTSDLTTRWTALGGTVTVLRSDTFAGELAGDERDWREHARRPRGASLSDRIEPDVRDRLSRMSRGEP